MWCEKIDLMKILTRGVYLVLYCGVTFSVTAAPEFYSPPGGFSVPTDPMSHFEESTEHKAVWQLAKQECTPIDLFELFTDQACMEALTEYFLNEPVWAYSQLNYYDPMRGLQPLPIKLINSRPRILPYSYADFQLDDIPHWRDIFDGKVPQRENTYFAVVANPKCKALSERSSVGIQSALAEQCAARELFKYATYLDSCFVALQRESVLINIPGFSGILSNETGSAYANMQDIIKEKIEDKTQQERALKRLEKGLLHAVWMRTQCSEHGYVMFPDIEVDESIEIPKTLFWQPGMVSMYHSINVTHDIILKIAAKSGDPWAIQSYPLGILTSSEFNVDVQRDHPLLFHRHLGSPTGWFRSELTEPERAQHQAQAYIMLKESIGAHKASFEYDPSELEEEIKFVTNGRKLKYPADRAEVFDSP